MQKSSGLGSEESRMSRVIGTLRFWSCLALQFTLYAVLVQHHGAL